MSKQKSGRLSLLIVREGKTEPISLQIPKWLIRTAVILFTFCTVVFIAAGVFYYLSYNKITEYDKVKKQNETLLVNQEKITSIINDLGRLKQTDQRIRELFGLGNVPNGNEAGGMNRDSIDEFISRNRLKDFNLLQKNADGQDYKYRNVPNLLPLEGVVSKGFKENDEEHFGIDIVAELNSVIKAAGDGVVVFEGWNDKYGNVIIIDHANGYLSIYKHNNVNKVKIGQFVYRGQMISLLGNSGTDSSGPHLHFEIWYNGTPVDPATILIKLKNQKE